jgi:hypothetical protein
MKTEELKTTEQTEEEIIENSDKITENELEKVDGGITNYHGSMSDLTPIF